jgi:hypothetical protein
MVIDINKEKAKRVVEEIDLLTANLLMSGDPFERSQLYNTIREKLDDLYESLSRLRNVA